LKSGVPLPTPGLFNASNRAYPDIGAVGENFCVLDPNQACNMAAGTSASCPLIASLITLLNQDRLNANKKPLGFVNPLIYKMYDMNPTLYFQNNMTIGNNAGECPPSNGFTAAQGWDPLTGVGSPNFGAIRKYIATLP